MPELGPLGSVRGAPSNGWPYRELRCAERKFISLSTRRCLGFGPLGQTVPPSWRIILSRPELLLDPQVPA